MSLPRLLVTLAALATVGVAAQASAAAAPQLLHFKSGGRIASGVVAGYDLKEESTDFEYRIRAERIKVAVFKRSAGSWKRIGVVRATPPRPLNFWRVFKNMGVGRYRLVARAVSGTGENRRQSAAKRIRFRVVKHIPHDD
jgi:hypothetical protein